jgi:GT2 family glycosyltransferase
VVPVRDGERWLEATLASIHAQADGRPLEVLAVEDGSRDGSPAILAQHATAGRVRELAGGGHGAAAAINLGLRHARYPILCQVDQDVVLEPGWLSALTEALDDSGVAAAQGWYVTPRTAGLWTRAAGLDLERRYAAIRGAAIDHVCTGNTAYRVEALRRIGGFDETLGYGYDNDLSYRLTAAGERLVFRRDARAVHHWRESARDYLRQQYGVGYGRLDVIARHPRRVGGDDVSGPAMIAHAAAMLAALAAGSVAALCGPLGVPWRAPALAAATLVGALAGERALAGVRAARRFRDAAPLSWPVIHLRRDAAWAAAIAVWALRRARGRASRPTDSMSPAR